MTREIRAAVLWITCQTKSQMHHISKHVYTLALRLI